MKARASPSLSPLYDIRHIKHDIRHSYIPFCSNNMIGEEKHVAPMRSRGEIAGSSPSICHSKRTNTNLRVETKGCGKPFRRHPNCRE